MPCDCSCACGASLCESPRVMGAGSRTRSGMRFWIMRHVNSMKRYHHLRTPAARKARPTISECRAETKTSWVRTPPAAKSSVRVSMLCTVVRRRGNGRVGAWMRRALNVASGHPYQDISLPDGLLLLEDQAGRLPDPRVVQHAAPQRQLLMACVCACAMAWQRSRVSQATGGTSLPPPPNTVQEHIE